jgi:hypothetical protein
LPDSMNRLTRLEEPWIFNWPKLSQWCGLEENRMKLAHIIEKVYALLCFLSCFSYWTTTFIYQRCWLCLLCRDFINVESSLKFGLVKFAVYFQRVAPLQLSIDRISWTCNYLVSIILAVNYHRLQCCARKDYLYVDMYQYWQSLEL